ncbi:hypothetical protein CHS0354_024541 [Potamilus streckersoni]|uniref:RING-type domain-containing protein n=1 Tax=Potamilus streckersoni TaxID=2493646 RepID=A0AAE0WHR3_9BIVA|nr:hypothetical protein CHS0354_024541 [Potamilus streckersoni]
MAHVLTGKSKVDIHCPICLQIFNRPRSLPCLHTFCHECLKRHIENITRNRFALGFPCPVCRSDTRIQTLNTNREEWITQFPINNWLVTYIEEKDSEEEKSVNNCLKHSDYSISLICLDHDSLCCPMCIAMEHRRCEEVIEVDKYLEKYKDQTNADSLLQDFQNISQNLSDLKEKRKDHMLSLNGQKEKLTRTVKDLTQKLVDHFYRLEAILICNIAVEYDVLKKDFEEEIKWCEENEIVIEKSLFTVRNVQSINSIYQKFVCTRQLKDLCNKLKPEIPKRAGKAKEIIMMLEFNNEVLTIPDQIISFGEVSCDGNQDSSSDKDENRVEKPSKHNSSGKPKRPHSSLRIEGCSTDLIPSRQTTITTPVVIPGEDPANRLSRRQPTFSEIREYPRREEYSSCDDRRVDKPTTSTIKRVQVVEINVRAPSDSFDCFITSIQCNTYQGKIVLVDYQNAKIKMISQSGRVQCEKKFSTDPVCLTGIKENSFVVTFPSEGRMRQFEIDSKSILYRRSSTLLLQSSTFVRKRSTRLDDDCFGIAFMNNIFIVSFHNCLKVYTLNGKELQNIFKNSDGVFLFLYARHLSCDEHRSVIYVTDEGKESLMSFMMERSSLINTNPKFIYTHERLRNPQASTTDKNGNIYICGFASNNIHILSHEGCMVKILELDFGPWALALDETGSKMLVSTTGETSDNLRCFDVGELWA